MVFELVQDKELQRFSRKLMVHEKIWWELEHGDDFAGEAGVVGLGDCG